MKLIFSADNNWGIGKDGDLLFKTKADMAYFREKTSGKIVVMGRKTLESLPNQKPLPNRTNVVITRNKGFSCEGAVVLNSAEEFLGWAKSKTSDDIFVIGGESIYKQLLDHCDTAFVTRFFAEASADRFMPNFDELSDWKLSSESEEMAENGITFKFLTYTRM